MSLPHTGVKILLINPPFCEPQAPYISIPTLIAYLRTKGAPAEAYDLNRAFFKRLMQPARVVEGWRWSQERFLALNDRSELDFTAMVEYLLLWGMLLSAERQAAHITPLLTGFADFGHIQVNPAHMFFPALITARDFPEGVVFKPDFIAFMPHKPHATADMLKALSHEGPYHRVWRTLLDRRLERHDPGIVGFSVVYKDQMIPALQCAAYIKRRRPELHVTLGGPFISIYLRELKETRLFTAFDSLVLDEGERPLAALSRELARANPDLSRVPGLVYLRNNTLQHNPSAPAPPLDQAPLPDYNCWTRDSYLTPLPRQTVNLRLSKGCMWRKCSFCRTDLYFYKHYEPLESAVAFEQVTRLATEQGVRRIHFSDEAADPRVLEELSRRILDSGLSVRWTTQTRVSPRLTRERCRLYRRAGCYHLWVGAETFSDRLLKLLRKGASRRMIREMIERVAGEVSLGVYMMVGIPTETEEEAREGFALVQKYMQQGLITGYRYNVFRVAHYSAMAKHPERFGIDRLRVPRQHDLHPNILDFDSRGMSRRRAYLLMHEFNSSNDPHRKVNHPQTALTFGGRPVRLRYDIGRIAAEVMSHWEIIYRSFGEFLALNQDRAAPMKPLSAHGGRATD